MRHDHRDVVIVHCHLLRQAYHFNLAGEWPQWPSQVDLKLWLSGETCQFDHGVSTRGQHKDERLAVGTRALKGPSVPSYSSIPLF